MKLIEAFFSIVNPAMTVTLVSAVVLLTGCSAPADPSAAFSDQPEGSYSGKSLDNWPAQLDHMSALLDLETSERAALTSVFETHVSVLQTWYTENGSTLADFENKMFAAAGERDLNQFNAYQSKAQPLRDEVLKLHEQYDQAIENTLPEEKRWKWFAHNNVRRIVKHTESLQLTEDQLAQMKKLAYQSVVECKTELYPERGGYAKLLAMFKTRVLNDQQRQAFDDLLKQKPLSFVYRR